MVVSDFIYTFAHGNQGIVPRYNLIQFYIMNTYLNNNERTNVINAIKKLVFEHGVWGTGLCGFNSLAVSLKHSNIIIDVKGYKNDWMNGKGRMSDVVVYGGDGEALMSDGKIHGSNDFTLSEIDITTIQDECCDAFCNTNVNEIDLHTLYKILTELAFAINTDNVFSSENEICNIKHWYKFAKRANRERDKNDLDEYEAHK